MEAENIAGSITPEQEKLLPGQRLKHARMEKKLDVDYVAHKLHLSKQQVQSIERDEYGYVSALAYARGHIRLYARLVDLSVNELLKAFDSLGLKEAPKPTKMIKTKRKRTFIKPKKASKLPMIIGLIAIVIATISLFSLSVNHHKPRAIKGAPEAASVSSTTQTIVQQIPSADSNAISIQIPLALPPDKTAAAPLSSPVKTQ